MLNLKPHQLAHLSRIFFSTAAALWLAFGRMLEGAELAGESTQPPLDAATKRELLEITTQLVSDWKAGNAWRIAARVHPRKGVRFSAYFEDCINPKSIVFDCAKMRAFWTTRRVYTWGYYDGSGDRIRTTPSRYCREWIFDHDFSGPDRIVMERETGSSIDSRHLRTAYPRGRAVEYFVDPTEGHMDWAALAFVLERYRGRWCLVGVLHRTWQI